MTKIQQKWLYHIKAYERSGLSQSDYCQKHGLNTKSFSVRKSQFSKKPSMGSSFISLKQDKAVKITLNSSVELAFENEPNPAWLAQLLQQMEKSHVGHHQV